MTTIALPITLALSLWLGRPPHVVDLLFGFAVEESIIAEFGMQSIPEPYLGPIVALGDARYLARESASARLRVISLIDSRWLLWGLHSRDLEVRLRCNTIMREIHRCPECDGYKVNKVNGYSPCVECYGVGSAWPWSIFD